ncbi:MAG: CRTAC1 family protein [Deltaproteobacteria bacterium]|nr:CRTAC1 family protein [Deltaproteobacteria bacterium]
MGGSEEPETNSRFVEDPLPHSRRQSPIYSQRNFPTSLAALLLAFSSMTLSCSEPPATTPTEGRDTSSPSEPGTSSPSGPLWFPDISSQVGLDFHHETGAQGELHLPEIMGSGAAWLDYDNDGDLDAFLANGTFDLGAKTQPDGPTQRLYRQEAEGRFSDVTPLSGLGESAYGMGVAAGDFDNDGNIDLYTANLGADRLYRNLGDGTFRDVSAAAGVAVDGWSSSVTFFDYDRDGHLDLYIVRYVDYDPTIRCYDFAGRREYCGPTAFAGQRDILLHNEGDGTFSDRSEAAGISSLAQAGLGLVTRDFNGDGWPDMYVANDADPNQLWINQTDGTFRDEALIQGASVNALGEPEAGMGVLAGDLDNDLDFDLFMTHLGDESNTLYRNLGDGLGFEDGSFQSGLATSSMVFTGFGTAAFDADLDGDLDLAAINGRVRRGELLPSKLSEPWIHYAEPNLFYLNEGQGTFEAMAPSAFASDTEISRGLALGDFDRDGDLDLLVSNTQGQARLYRNDLPRSGHWLLIEAFDPRLNRLALGAEIQLTAGSHHWLRTLTASGSYQSSHAAATHFGLGESQEVDEIEVRWPDGLKEKFGPAPANQRLRLVRGQGNRP